MQWPVWCPGWRPVMRAFPSPVGLIAVAGSPIPSIGGDRSLPETKSVLAYSPGKAFDRCSYVRWSMSGWSGGPIPRTPVAG